MDIRTSLAAQGYGQARPATRPTEGTTGRKTDLASFAESFVQGLADNEETARQAMVSDADPHALVQALAETELAIETAVTLRDKVVEAYQEILRMPV